MEKNIYDLLNDVKVEIESYPLQEMNELEKKKLLKGYNMKEQHTKQKRNYKKCAAIASFVLVGLTGISSIQTLASINPTMHTIAHTLGVNKDLADYVNVVGKPVTKDGTTIELGEAIYDKQNNKFILSTIISSEDGVKEGTIWSPHIRLYINGEEMNVASLGTRKEIDENTVGFVTEHILKQEFDGDMDVKIVIAGVEVNDVYEKKRWNFEFTANGEELAKDTYKLDLKHKVVLQNGEELVLEYYTNNALGQSIYYSVKEERNEMIMLKGQDDLGNPVVFEMRYGETSKGGEFAMDKEVSKVSDNATSMTLQVYSLALPEEGPITSEYKPVGQPFTIPLQQ